jgi:glycosyltransferase involved in cell wall biosynthesis
MNAGVPIVATRVGGVPDVVNSSHALLVPAEKPLAIADSLKELERDGLGAANRSVRARERLLQAFALPAWLDAIDKVYDEAIKGRKGTRDKA